MAQATKTKIKTKVKAKKKIPPTKPVDCDDEKYSDVVWGILREPILCNDCGKKSFTASYVYEGDSKPYCHQCWFKRTYPNGW